MFDVHVKFQSFVVILQQSGASSANFIHLIWHVFVQAETVKWGTTDGVVIWLP